MTQHCPYYGHWSINTSGPFDPTQWYGFIYRIVHHPTDHKYIGSKRFWSIRKGHREQSDWPKYQSSSKDFKQLIATTSKRECTFEIMALCSGLSELTYTEAWYQFHFNVMTKCLPNGRREYYNRNILGKFFNGLERYTHETRLKMHHGAEISEFRQTHDPYVFTI